MVSYTIFVIKNVQRRRQRRHELAADTWLTNALVKMSVNGIRTGKQKNYEIIYCGKTKYGQRIG